MNDKPEIPLFGSADPTDGRALLDWRSKYTDPEARSGIKYEAIYIACLLFAVPVIMLLLWLEYPKYLFHWTDEKYQPIMKYGLAWFSGSLGGALFDAKWLYHSVARKLWHEDRRLWRLFTPHISGGLAFAIVALIGSGLLRIFDATAMHSRVTVVAVGFLVGYFSDSAVAKLTEIADTLFGPTRSKEEHRLSGPASGHSAEHSQQ